MPFEASDSLQKQLGQLLTPVREECCAFKEEVMKQGMGSL